MNFKFVVSIISATTNVCAKYEEEAQQFNQTVLKRPNELHT